MTSIKLYRGGFGHVSVLNVASDLVTHAHPEAHVIIWMAGVPGHMCVGERVVVPGPGTAVAINSFEPHSHTLSGDGGTGLFLALYINPDWVSRRCGVTAGPLFAEPEIAMAPWLSAAARHLYATLSSEAGPDDFTGFEIERLVDSLVDASRAQISRMSRVGTMTCHYDYRVRKAIELMKANICERICFDDLARQAGLSRAHFFTLFKEQTGLTPNVYWNTLRMEEARRQLQTSQDPLISVACNLGFTTQGNFTRFFRDHVGVPPMQYREAARNPH